MAPFIERPADMYPNPHRYWPPGYDNPHSPYARPILAEQIRHGQARALVAGRRQGYMLALRHQMEDEEAEKGKSCSMKKLLHSCSFADACVEERLRRERQRGRRETPRAGKSRGRGDRDTEYARLPNVRRKARSRSRHAGRTKHRRRSPSRIRGIRRDSPERERRGRSGARTPRLSTIYPEDSMFLEDPRPHPNRNHREPERRGRSRVVPTHYERSDYPPTLQPERSRRHSPHNATYDRERSHSVVHPFTRDDHGYAQNYASHQTPAPRRAASTHRYSPPPGMYRRRRRSLSIQHPFSANELNDPSHTYRPRAAAGSNRRNRSLHREASPYGRRARGRGSRSRFRGEKGRY